MRRSNGGLFGGRNHRHLTRYNDRGNFLSLPYNTTKFSSSFTVTRIANILLLTCFLLYLLVCFSSISILFADHPNEHHTTVISPGVLMDERSNQLSASRSMENANQKYDIHEEVIWNLQTALDSSEPYVNVPLQKQREELEFLFDVKREGENDDGWDVYYARDDDEERGKREQTLYDDVEDFCTRPSFYHMYKPSCNELHSHVSGYDWMFGEDGASTKSKYLGSGTYRNVFLLEREFANKLRSKSSHETDVVIFKTMKQFKPSDKKHSFEEVTKFDPYKKYHTIELYDDMRKDAMVMELLTSSPRIANIYSFCGMSSLIEYAPGNVEKTVMPTGGKTYDELKNGLAENGYEPMDEVVDNTPVNDSIPPQEKLEIALEIAKGISTMHGHSLGPIAHVDVQFGQFYRGTDGLIKIIDFNRAEALLYDVEKEKYCTFSNGVPPAGSLRAPEEIINAPLTEKIDVYTVGNVFYSILTGLLVNRNCDISKAHYRVSHGKTEPLSMDYFESRSAAEFALAKAIQWCWTFDFSDRPSIFEVVEFLENEVKNNSNPGKISD